MSDKSYLSVYAKSFNWAGFFLPKETLKKCSALYDFCRVADNLADDAVSYTHLRAHETDSYLVCRLVR